MTSEEAARPLRVLVASVGWLAVAISCTVLIGGWSFGIITFKSVLPGLNSMKPNTAVSIGALGMGLLLTAGRTDRGAARDLFAGLALALGCVTLAEYAFGWNAGIDQLLFADDPSASFPGRPSAVAALMMALLGAALLCVRRPALHALKSTSAVTAGLFAWVAINVYVFGRQSLQAVPAFSSVALHTSALMFLLSIATLATEPVFSPLATVFARNSSGIVSRWMLPPAIFAPPLLGWFLGRSSLLDAYSPAFRWALYSTASSLGSVWLITMLVWRITLIDAERSAARELSLRDPLTGLANRRAFDSFLTESLAVSRRYGRALSLLMVDIDRFKSYNDAYGHPQGDELLKALALSLGSAVRASDLVARMGGEEFAIALPETDLAGALVIAERVRAEVEGAKRFRRPVTVSVGVATLRRDTPGTAALIQECDAALYEAKRSGRNRVAAPQALAATG